MSYPKRVLTLDEYRIIYQHLKEGWSFWSLPKRVDIGMRTLVRLNKEDLTLKLIRQNVGAEHDRARDSQKGQGLL